MLPRDARWYQIAVLATLLVYGNLRLDFGVTPLVCGLVFTVGLCTQYLGSAWARIRFDAKSCVISCLSLAILLRADDPSWLALAAFLAIASKFVLRINGKHVFNPTNFAIAVLLYLLTPHVWVSASQWGFGAVLAFVMGCLGVMVVTRARRADVTLAFLAAYGAMHTLHALLLDEPAAIPLHALANGAVVLFAFFMISDPKTTPNHWLARLLFAVWVAALGSFIQLWLYKPRGLFYALFLVSLATPWLDALFREVSTNAPLALAAASDARRARPRLLRPLRRQG
jgi:Na+-transporting NADH:ubiquinone oxidoreductase subunit NqrB